MGKHEEIGGDPARQAVASLAGVAFQAWASIDAWLRLGDEELIFLEGAEDFDRVGGKVPDTVTQVRHTAASSSLGNAKALKALEDFWVIVRRNEGRVVHMHYLTTSSVAAEQGESFGGLAGINAWPAARTQASLATAISKFLQQKLPASSALRSFLAAAKVQEVQDQLLKRFSWFMDQPGLDVLERGVEERLILLLAARQQPTRFAEKIKPPLLSRYWKALTDPQSGSRRLSRADLVQVVDDALTTYLPIPVERAHLIDPSALQPGLPLLVLLSGKVPVPPQPLLTRTSLTSEVQRRIEQRGAVLLSGGVFKGKTTMAQLVAAAMVPDAWWLPLTDKPHQQVDLLLLALADQVEKERFPALVVIDDIELTAQSYRVFGSSLALVIQRATRSGRSVLLTAQGTSNSAASFSAIPQLAMQDIPEFTDDEIAAAATSMGCPESAAQVVGAMVRLRTFGHPKLVQVRLVDLAKNGWRLSGVNDFIQESPGTSDAKGLARQLFAESATSSVATLVYSASEAMTLLHRDVLLALGEACGVQNAGDVIDQLNGTWIESVETHWFRVTPLLKGAATHAWSTATIQGNHKRLHDAFLQKGKLSPDEAGALLYHAYFAASWRHVALHALKFQMLKGSAAEKPVYQALFWLPYISLDPNSQVAGNPLAGASLRSLQFKVAAALEASTLPQVCARWVEEVEAIPDDEPKEMMRGIMLGTFLTDECKDTPLEFRLKAVEEMPKLQGEIGAHAASTLISAVAGEARKGGIPGDASPAALMLLLASRWVRNEQALRTWLRWLDQRADAQVQREFDEMLAWPLTQTLGAVVQSAWAAVHESVSDWNPWIALFDEILDYARRRGSPRFGVEAAKAKSIILCEHLNQQEGALTVLRDAQSWFGPSALLEEQRANVLFQGRNDQQVLEIWERLTAEASTVLKDPYAWRRAAISASRLGRFAEAAHLFLRGADALEQGGFELTRFAMRADAALCEHHAGNPHAAACAMCRAVESLPPAAAQQGERRWEAALRISSEICRVIDTAADADAPPLVSVGAVSSPSSLADQASDGQEFRYFHLRAQIALLGARHAVASEVVSSEIRDLLIAPYMLVRMEASQAAIAQALSKGGNGFAEALVAFDRVSAEMSVAGTGREAFLRRDGGPAQTGTLGVPLPALLISAAWAASNFLVDALAQWVEHFEGNGMHASAAAVREIRRGALIDPGRLPAAIANREENVFFRCGAVIALLQRERHPAQRLKRQATLTSALVAQNPAFEAVWSLAIARWLAAEWEQVSENKFLQVRPATSQSHLKQAIEAVRRGASGAGGLFAAAYEAMGLALPGSLRTLD